MRTNLAIFLIILFLFPISSMGEILTIKQTVKQTFGGGQSVDDARISGIAKAKREALEKAGTYIESLTVVKDAKVEKDEILALTAGVLKAEVVSQKNYASDDAFGIEIVVNVVVDTSVLEERVKKQLQDRTHLTQLKETQKREKELLQKVAQLEEENRNLSAKMQSTEKLKKEFQQATNGLTAVDWFYKADALWDGKKYTEPKKAIEYLNNAIELQPEYANAYVNRGIAYHNLSNYNQAIADYDKAIELNPKFVIAYSNRGSTYGKIGNHKQAMKEFNTAIELNAKYAPAYIGRGDAYSCLGDFQQAIKEYDKGIDLNPKDVSAYANRGGAYFNDGKYQEAVDDWKIAAKLGHKKSQEYLRLRGIEYDSFVTRKGALYFGYFGMIVHIITTEIAEKMALPEMSEVVITDVKRGSPADKVGLNQGDIILQVNKVKISTMEDYHREMTKRSAKDSVTLLIKRGKSMFFVKLEND